MKGRKIKTFFKLSYKEKLLVVEIFFLCGIVRLIILTVPFSYIRKHLGKYGSQSTTTVEKENYKITYRVGTLVSATSKYTPWQSKCLVQAIVAQHILKRHCLGTTLYFGVAKDHKGQTQAHAWLRYGEMIVTGGEVANYFKTVGYYSNESLIKERF